MTTTLLRRNEPLRALNITIAIDIELIEISPPLIIAMPPPDRARIYAYQAYLMTRVHHVTATTRRRADYIARRHLIIEFAFTEEYRSVYAATSRRDDTIRYHLLFSAFFAASPRPPPDAADTMFPPNIDAYRRHAMPRRRHAADEPPH